MKAKNTDKQKDETKGNNITNLCLGILVINISTNQKKTQGEKVKLLANLGYSKEDMALILETTKDTINTRLYELSKGS